MPFAMTYFSNSYYTVYHYFDAIITMPFAAIYFNNSYRAIYRELDMIVIAPFVMSLT
jgi:hypothetical protein